MKYLFVAILAGIAPLAAFFFFVFSWWTGLIYTGSLVAVGAYAFRIYGRHHESDKFYGSIDEARQREALEWYVSQRKRVLEGRSTIVKRSHARLAPSRQIGHLECIGCGQFVSELLPVTAKDLQIAGEEHFMRVCSSCREWVRSAFQGCSRCSPYKLVTALRDTALAVPIVSGCLLSLAMIAVHFNIVSIGGFGTASVLSSSALFTGCRGLERVQDAVFFQPQSPVGLEV